MIILELHISQTMGSPDLSSVLGWDAIFIWEGKVTEICYMRFVTAKQFLRTEVMCDAPKRSRDSGTHPDCVC